jgi:hypothetical protein
MNKSLIHTFYFSRYFVPFTILVSCFLGLIWRQKEISLNPPTLSNWQWSDHSKVLWIHFVRTYNGCLCSKDLQQVIDSSLSHGADVVVTGSRDDLESIELSPEKLSSQKGTVKFKVVDRPLFSKSTTVFVVNGKIRKKIPGIFLPKELGAQS